MFCINCGAQNDDDSMFCMKCGAKITGTNNQQANVVNNNTATPNNNSVPQQTNQVPNFQTNGTQVPNTQQTQVQAPVQEGYLSAAWHDIKSSPGWFKKVLLMALLNIIPFLNLGTIGYSQKWGVDVAKGDRNKLPKQIFNNRNFLCGILEYVTWTALGFVYIVGGIIVNFTLGGIPILGILITLAIIVFCWFFNSFVALASMKGALYNELGESFRIKKVIKAMKKGFGGVFCSYFVPSLICGIISFVIIFILILIFTMSAAGAFAGISSAFSSPYTYSNPNAFFNNVGAAAGAITTLASAGIAILVIAIVLIVFVSCFMGTFEKLLRYRALGHWIKRNAPEWLDEHEEHSAVKKE